MTPRKTTSRKRGEKNNGETSRNRSLRAETAPMRRATDMTEMIRTLLDFAESRFEEGLPVAPGPCDLSEIAAAAVADLRAVHGRRVITFEAPLRLHRCWDGARMAQVVSNLVA